jgi:hypothetical protein
MPGYRSDGPDVKNGLGCGPTSWRCANRLSENKKQTCKEGWGSINQLAEQNKAIAFLILKTSLVSSIPVLFLLNPPISPSNLCNPTIIE